MSNERADSKTSKIWQCLGFLAGLFLLLTGLSIAVRPGENDVYNLSNYTRTLEAVRMEKPQTIDVLFAGDSEASDGFSPLQFWGEQGISSYNISNPAQILNDSYAILVETVKEQNVKVLVLETSCMYLKSEIYSDDQWLAMAEKAFPIFHYHQVYRLLKPKSVSFQNIQKSASLKGFWLKTGVRPYEGTLEYMGSKDADPLAFQSSTYPMLDKLIGACRENNIKVVLVSMPAPVYWNYSRHNAVQEWADEYGLEYIDFNLMNDELGMDWSQDTTDGGNHLSFSGTVKVCSWLADYLHKTYSLPDHRGDPQYDSWQNAYEETGLYGGSES